MKNASGSASTRYGRSKRLTFTTSVSPSFPQPREEAPLHAQRRRPVRGALFHLRQPLRELEDGGPMLRSHDTPFVRASAQVRVRRRWLDHIPPGTHIRSTWNKECGMGINAAGVARMLGGEQVLGRPV